MIRRPRLSPNTGRAPVRIFYNPGSRRAAANPDEDTPMSDLAVKFEAAAAASTTLKERPDNDTLLSLYSLYKQATTGDVEGKRPGFTDMRGRAKYDAWAKLRGTGKEEAMKQYIALVDSLKS